MAVEMAKLSLWLVSMDAARPFTFLDDRIVAGDSLLGIADVEQLECLHLDPKKARELRAGTLDWAPDVRGVVARAAALRREIGEIELGDDPLAALDHKRALLEQVAMETGQLRLFADLTVGAALAGSRKPGGSRDPRMREAIADDERVGKEGLHLEAVTLAQHVAAGEGEAAALMKARRWLATDQPPGAFPRTPLHWPLAFPRSRSGAGSTRSWATRRSSAGRSSPARSARPTASTWCRRSATARGAARTWSPTSRCAPTSCSTAAGRPDSSRRTRSRRATRARSGSTSLPSEGVRIRRAVKSERWPSRSAALEYCVVWTSRAPLGSAALRVADGVPVSAITPSLEPAARVTGNPHRLAANAGLSFQGSYVLGLGFTMTPERAAELIAEDPRNADVVFPYLNGQDLNTDPACAASRWVINFHDWPEERRGLYGAICIRCSDWLSQSGERHNRDGSRRELPVAVSLTSARPMIEVCQ